jgi:peptidoglycan hydrolase-like protein with peptidoglycan-binding domain
MEQRYIKNPRLLGGLGTVFISFVAVFTIAASAQAATCTITRDLTLGVTGEDVRCLQQYLNNNGFTIAESGPGAKGNETGEFKALTEAAVRKWQEAKGITPATGSFGPRSRALLASEQSGSGTVLGVDTAASASGTTVSSGILQAILSRLVSIERRLDALEGKKPAESTAKPSTPATTPQNTQNRAEQAAAEIERLEAAIADAEDEIAEADDDGERVGVAEELLEEVSAMLSQAESQNDAKNYDRVLVITKRALPLVAEAVNAIGKRSSGNDDEDDEQEELEKRLEDLRDELDDARDEVEEAEDNDENTGDAEDLLDEAEDLLDDAEDALDDEDFNEVEDLLDEAEDLIEEALDEL